MVWFDAYSAGISLLCSAMFEAMAVTYFYGNCRLFLELFDLLYFSMKGRIDFVLTSSQ